MPQLSVTALLTGFLIVLWADFSAAQTSAVVASPASEAEKANPEGPQHEYVRIRRNDRRLAIALETSVIQFSGSKNFPNTSIDLLGAIHLGEKQYYETLNQKFAEYDVLLYEAVMPEAAVRRGLRPGGGGGGRRALGAEREWTEAKVGLHAISVLQEGAREVLGLEFQLNGIDYGADNFVHADMTQEEFERSMERRGESFSQMLAREMAKAAIKQQKTNPLAQQLDLMMSMIASDRLFRARRIFAVELSKANEGDTFAGPDGTSTIITERNIKALEVLRQQLNQGRRKIGIFYGAGHFPDMETRLTEEFGFERSAEQWLTAWELREPVTEKPKASPSPSP